MMQPVAPGADQTGQNSAAKPADEPALPPISEDEGHAAPDDTGQGDQPPPKSDDEPRRTEAQKPPSDQMRDQIAARFDRTKTHEPGGADDDAGESDEPLAPAEGAQGTEPPAKGEKPDGDQPAADKITLKVFGKDHQKSIDEVAVLADMTPDEVRQFPAQAAKIAQKQMAADHRLEETRRIQREASSRLTSGEQDGRPAPRAPDKERPEAGTDVSDQQRGTTDTPVTAKQLIDDIQIGSPEDAAAKLEEFVNRTVKSVTDQALSEKQRNDAVIADHNNTRSAMKEFVDAHPDLKGKRYVPQAIAAGMVDEYREDLREAMIFDGVPADEASDILDQVSPAEIINAHQKRRIVDRHPKVRQIDRSFIEAAYTRVSGELGAGSQQQQNNQQDLQAQRQQRKENLTPQPRRASVPPAATQPAAKPQTRSAAVAELAVGRGQKGPSSPR